MQDTSTHPSPDDGHNPQADRLIREALPLRRIYHLFPSQQEALAYAASTLCVLYGDRNATGPCCVCGSEQAGPTEFRWSVRRIIFATHHPICPACRPRVRRTLLAGSALRLAGTLDLLVAMCLLAWWLFYPAIALPLVGAFLAVSGIAALLIGRRMRLPRPMRRFIPPPVNCISIG
jgi:hypothetical protein